MGTNHGKYESSLWFRLESEKYYEKKKIIKKIDFLVFGFTVENIKENQI